MIKYICIKDYYSENIITLKIHGVGVIYDVEIFKKQCKLYTSDNSYYQFDTSFLNEYFITLAEFRESRINKILDENIS